MTTAEKLELALTIDRRERENNRILSYYPDTGPLRRELYPKHLEFFRLGSQFRNRMMMASNRSGKSTVGCFETVLHATGRYKEYAPWWQGKRFDHPISCIVAGDTNLTTRDILQVKLFGRLTRKLGDPLSEALGLRSGALVQTAYAQP